MKVSEYQKELINWTSFDTHPKKPVDTFSINKDNIGCFFFKTMILFCSTYTNLYKLTE